MLINCPECGKQVSDKAESCPNCGMPMFAVKHNKVDAPKPITIQQTNKEYKAMGCIGVLIGISGVMAFLSNPSTDNPIAIIMIISGIVCWVVAWVGKWWNND